MDISLMQVIADSIPDLLMSQNGIRVIRLLFYLQKILINVEFALFLVGQGVCIKDKGISE